MNNTFVGKIFYEDEFLGTAFLIKHNIAYSACHCFDQVDNFSNCYIEFKDEKYYIGKISKIDEIDFVEIILNCDVINIELPEISTECINSNERLNGFGYKEVDGDIIGVHMKLIEYPVSISNDSKADLGFMVEGEVDYARWNGISGSPIFDDNSLRGIVIKNYGNDGLKTRIEIVSFNKIINYLVDNRKEEIIENFPSKFLNSDLYKSLLNNKNRCEKLYYTINHKIENDCIDIVVNFINTFKEITINSISDELEKAIYEYALFLEERYSEENILDSEKIKRVFERVTEVKERMKNNFNSIYIVLWMLTEGIIGSPRVGRILLEQDYKYVEEDIYLKRREGKITILIPIIAIYEDIFEAILNVVKTIQLRKGNGFFNLNDIEWDGESINCLDIKSKVEIGKIIRGDYLEPITIDISALAIYNSDIYSSIPKIINTKERTERFFESKFSEEFTNNLEKYQQLMEEMNILNEIKVNLFILPVIDVNKIESI